MLIKIVLTTGETVWTSRYSRTEAVNARDARLALEVGGESETQAMVTRVPLRTIFPEAIASIAEVPA